MPFNSSKCRAFAKDWNFEIITSSPRYPKSNGQAERAVHTAKRMLKKRRDSDTELELALLEFMNAVISGINLSPAQILYSRRTRTKIPTHKIINTKYTNKCR